jgi:hypothetical protein
VAYVYVVMRAGEAGKAAAADPINQGKSNRNIAEEAGVSHMTIGRARAFDGTNVPPKAQPFDLEALAGVSFHGGRAAREAQAKEAGFSRTAIEAAQTLLKNGTAEEIEAYRSGQIALQKAANIVRARNPPGEAQRTATVEAVKRNGNIRKRGKTMGDRVRAYNEATGFKIMSITVRKAKPIGRMPDDTRQKIEGHIAEIKHRQFKLEMLLEYANKMSEPLRHVFADELRDLRGKFDALARIALGGSDLRKIDRPLCHVEIPLRKDEEPAGESGELSA